MIQVCSIASGSNGNCYYVGNENDAVLVDSGIYYKTFVERCNISGIDISKIRAVFVSHEHGDHIRGVKVMSKRLFIPVFFNLKTYSHAYKSTLPAYCKFLEAEQSVKISEGFTVKAFSKQHDVADPLSFIIQIQDKTVGVITDLGVADQTVCENFGKCDVAFLESNYDTQMLLDGSYPEYLKRRVNSSSGHLSNDQAFGLITGYASKNLTHIILSHISQENNSEEKILEKFSPLMSKYNISIASRYQPGEIINL